MFELWNDVPENQPIDVASICERHFISIDESIGLILFTAYENPGRYIVNSSALIRMNDVAERLYPNREKILLTQEEVIGFRKVFSQSENIEKYLLNNL